MNVSKDILKAVDSASYICSMCGMKIYPLITDINYEDGTISLSNDMCSFNGGVGNKKIVDHVCPECAKKCNLRLN